MKKIFTLCLFVCALFLGTQSSDAQESKLEMTKIVNAEAAKKTEALRKYVKFDNNQRDQIYEAYREHTSDKYMIKNQKVVEKKIEEKEKMVDERLETKIKTILNPEQYDRYQSYIRSN